MAFESEKTESAIKAAIEKITKGQRYEVWTVGITDNVDLRREEHGRPTIWHYWTPESEEVAKNVEAYCVAKGIEAYTGTGTGQGNLYITWA
ncbi:hypothetical protein ACFLVZ_02550 [Chloroflexota bacterium]